MNFNVAPRTPQDDLSSPQKASTSHAKKRSLDSDSSTNGASKKTNIANPKEYKHVVFDIEGTTTPITFVKDVLFPYAASNAKKFLESTWDTAATQADIAALQAQAQEDSVASGKTCTLNAPASDMAKLSGPLVDFIKTCIEQDRKVGALKQFQGHIWDIGYGTSLPYCHLRPVLYLFISSKILMLPSLSVFSNPFQPLKTSRV